MRTLITGGEVFHSSSGNPIMATAAVFVEDSRIVAVGDEAGLAKQPVDVTVDASNYMVLPGLIDMHYHSYGSLARGLGDGLLLEPWYLHARAMTVNRRDEEVRASVLAGASELLRSGVTTVLDHLGGGIDTLDAAIDAHRDTGMRVALAPMAADVHMPRSGSGLLDDETLTAFHSAWPKTDRPLDLTAYDQTMRRLAERWVGSDGYVQIVVGPSMAYTSSDALLECCGNLARDYDLAVHMHLLESPAEYVGGMAMPDRTMTGRMRRFGLLGPRTSCAHSIWCSAADLSHIADAGATLVTNPWSNLLLGSSIAPTVKWKQNGIASALGTDGCNCGGSVDMTRNMSLALGLSRIQSHVAAEWLTPTDVLEMASANGAFALGRAGEIGTIAPGAYADLVFVRKDSPRFLGSSDTLRMFLLGGCSYDIDKVMVGGRFVLEDGVPVTFDERRALDEAKSLSVALQHRHRDLLEFGAQQADTLQAMCERAYEVLARSPVELATSND